MPDESLVGGDAPTITKPAPVAAQHPLGNPEPPPAAPSAASIVDTILNLDELLSADVRRAEKSVTIYLRPDLEGRRDELEEELDLLTDSAGRPLSVADRGLEDGRSYDAVYTEQQDVLREYAASGRRIRFRQMPDDEWDEFLAQHKDSDKPGEPRPKSFWNDLIAASAVAPKMTVAQVAEMRKTVGSPPLTLMGNAAWEVNALSGVSIPKSRHSSRVPRQALRETS